MHYYFHTRGQIYDCLVAEAYSIVAECIAQAKCEDTLLNQLSAFVTAAYRSGLADRSMLRFTMMARLEFHRSLSLGESPGPVIFAVHAFYRVDGRRCDRARRDSGPAPTRWQWCTCCWRCFGDGLLSRIHCRSERHGRDCQATPSADDSRFAESAGERTRAHHRTGKCLRPSPSTISATPGRALTGI